jgi:sugar phosphate isomerase/epimerase
MFISGLVSISFRKFDPDKVIAMVKKAGLEAIEWGGDAHVPHGDIAKATEVREKCDAAGIVLPSYGSYYKAASDDVKNPEFADVLACATALGVKTIRVWAGGKGSAEASPEFRQAVTEDLLRISALSAQVGISISLEFHGGTLTDTRESTLELMAAVPDTNIKFYWQPPVGVEIAENLETIELMDARISNIHVFHWALVDGQNTRLTIAEGIEPWTQYFTALDSIQSRAAMLEFVKDDSEEQFYQDAATLKKLLKK